MLGRRNGGACGGFLSSVGSRRDLLRAGALTLGGISFPGFGRAGAAATSGGPGPGRAKACILVFASGRSDLAAAIGAPSPFAKAGCRPRPSFLPQNSSV